MNILKTDINFVSSIKDTLIKITLISVLLIPIHGVQAISIEPMVFELMPIGNEANETVRIENPSQNPITMEITAVTFEFDELGNETNSPAEDDFLIYPPQVIIPGGGTQVVRVKYVGDPLIDKSQAYRIVVNQLPVDLTNTGSSKVSILTRFLLIANVAPKDSEPELNVNAITENDENQWLLTVENSGNRFGVLAATSWEIESLEDSNKNKKLSTDEVSNMIDRSFVLPNSTLQITIPAIEGYDPSKTQIKISG